MRVPRSVILDPARNGIFAVSAIALSVFVFAYSTHFGPAAILLYYTLWLPLFPLDPGSVIGRPRDIVLPGLFVVVIVASTLWSQAPAVSLRGSLQFASHALCVLAAARVVNFRSLTRGLLIGIAVVVLYSLAFGYSAYDAMDGSYTFVGAFGSKNQLGLYCSMFILFALFSVLTQRERLPVRVAVTIFAVVCLAVLDASRSATSTIALALAAIAFLGLIALLRLGTMLRGFVLLLLAPASALVALGAHQMGVVNEILRFFGKDPTLTGRTYLWEIGLRAIEQSPMLGLGYLAYWTHGNPEAELLWAEFYITARTGFHFHNALIQTLVDVGILGTVLLAALFFTVLARSARDVVADRSSIAACFLSLALLFGVRAFSEVDFLYQYSLGSFVLLYAYLRLRAREPARSAFARPVPASGLGPTGPSAQRGGRDRTKAHHALGLASPTRP